MFQFSHLISPSDLALLTSINLSTLNTIQCGSTQLTTVVTEPVDLICSLAWVKVRLSTVREIIILIILQDAFLPVHWYLSMAVCLLGTAFNMVNMLVLTHKDMRSNPINLILTGIAVADCLVMLEYIPFNIHMYLLDDQLREKEEKVNLL